MDKKQVKEVIYDMLDFIEKEHPRLYFLHNREEVSNIIDLYLCEKTEFNSGDLFYLGNKAIKYLLGSNDSHTAVKFDYRNSFDVSSVCFDALFMCFDDKVYIADIAKTYDVALFGELIKINNVDINTIVAEIKECIHYATSERLKVDLCQFLKRFDELKSLPSIDSNSDKIVYTVKTDNKTMDLKFVPGKDYGDWVDTVKFPDNYTYEIKDDVIVLNYTRCDDFDAMDKFVDDVSKVTKYNYINKYIVDLRYNSGGNSNVSDRLIDYLKDKDVIVLVSGRTFSSGIITYKRLRNAGAYSIGTDVGDILNHFGDCSNQKDYDEYKLKVMGSTVYFGGVLRTKKDFDARFDESTKLKMLESEHVLPDLYVDYSIDDLKMGIDPQMEAAILYFRDKDKNKSL